MVATKQHPFDKSDRDVKSPRTYNIVPAVNL